MKSLELKQIEVEMSYGTVRMLINRVVDGEKLTPHLVGIFAEQDAVAILAENKADLESQGYPWIDDAMIAKALKHRDLILSDPDVQAANAVLAAQRKQAADDAEAARVAEQAKADADKAAAKAEQAAIEEATAERIAALIRSKTAVPLASEGG
jgi:regulator of protease activity HflC (stomatin/prohibitin superfamily)